MKQSSDLFANMSAREVLVVDLSHTLHSWFKGNNMQENCYHMSLGQLATWIYPGNFGCDDLNQNSTVTYKTVRVSV